MKRLAQIMLGLRTFRIEATSGAMPLAGSPITGDGALAPVWLYDRLGALTMYRSKPPRQMPVRLVGRLHLPPEATAPSLMAQFKET